MRQQFTAWTTVAIVAAAIAVRGAYIALEPVRLSQDIDAYEALALGWIEHGTLGIDARPTAFRPPLYPLVLGLLWQWGQSTGAVAVLHLVLGAGTVYITLRLGRRLELGACAYLAAVLVALDPLLVHHSTLLMTETLFTFLVTVALSALIWTAGRFDFEHRVSGIGFRVWRALVAGVLIGIAALCRPTIWAFVPFAMLAVAVWVARRVGATGRLPTSAIGARVDKPPTRSPKPDIRSLLLPLALLIGMLLAVSPWVLRNWHVLGWPVVTTTHGGQTFWRANNHWFYEARIGGGTAVWPESSQKEWERRVAEVTAGLGEVAADRACYREAWQTIRERPGDFLRAARDRLAALWRPWPQAETYGQRVAIAVGIFYGCEFFLALAGLLRPRTWRWPWVLLPLLLISFSLVHAFYWTDMRMRAALVPAVALLAAAGLQTILSRATAARAVPKLLA